MLKLTRKVLTGQQNRLVYLKRNGVQEKIISVVSFHIHSQIVELLQSNSLSISGITQSEIHPKTPNEEALNWIFLVDTLNFCFWTQNGDHWSVTWKGKKYTGYFALCAAVNRALEEGYSITNPKYYSQISLRDLKTILRGDNKLVSVQLLNKRLDCLHEVGLTLLERFDGKFLNCVSASNGSAEKLLRIIVENFPCYKDETHYKGQKVSLYKRAQILIGDIWICFKGQNEGHFNDIDKLTMFADYRIPQVLVHFNIFHYSDDLMEKLKRGLYLQFHFSLVLQFYLHCHFSTGVLLDSGSPEEVEIRGCSIHAVELLNKKIKQLKNNIVSNVNQKNSSENSIICNSILIDHYLWDYRRQHASELESIPFHRTLSIFY